MTNKPLVVRKSIAKVWNQNVGTAKIGCLLQFPHYAQYFTPSSAQPHHFFTSSTSKSHKVLESTHSRTMASITMALLQLYACTKHLM